MSETEKPRVRVQARSIEHSAAYMKGDRNPLLVSWRPALREHYEDVRDSWQLAAARTIDATQNNGFLAGAVDASLGAVVGDGLRMSARPDAKVLGWTEDKANEWAEKAEAAFAEWANTPHECDAGGRMSFAQMQQAQYRCWLAYGESFALMPLIQRPNGKWATKVHLLPPSRIANKNNAPGLIQGVQMDAYGYPVGYWIREKDTVRGEYDVLLNARDADGRPNILHNFDAQISTVRGISVFAPIIKVVRQIDQYADATLTTALLQTIFAVTVKSNLTGISAFEGLFTEKDSTSPNGILDIGAYAEAKGQWYEGSKVDLTQHGRISHLFPTDELEFHEAKAPVQQYDGFMGWLLRETARAVGVTYENATGDYRGATYSSVRMAGAQEWLTVLRRRRNIVIPFCQAVYQAVLEEAIATKRLSVPGGLAFFYENRHALTRAAWTGPPRPQADEFKTARAYEVRKTIGATTLAEIAGEYGLDWDDMLRQQAREKDLALKLGLPDPWAPKDIMQVPGGTESVMNPPSRTAPADGDEPDAEAELQSELEAEAEAD